MSVFSVQNCENRDYSGERKAKEREVKMEENDNDDVDRGESKKKSVKSIPMMKMMINKKW